MKLTTTVIHHSADYDGIFCREIARKFLPDATLIGWDFSDPPLKDLPEGPLYVMDLPLDKPLGLTNPSWIEQAIERGQTLIWIDHHKSAIESHPKDVPGYRIDGVAACRLAWQWFTTVEIHKDLDSSCPFELPLKQDFVNRTVPEPTAVRLAGEYDIWDKRDPDAETFQYALRVTPLNTDGRDRLFDDNPLMISAMLRDGHVCQRYGMAVDEGVCKARSFPMRWEGLNWLCVNSARFDSLFFAAKDIPENGHDALMGFCWTGSGWAVSLYHAKHRADLDLSPIAVKYGGGGHRGACGFTTPKLPFELNAK